MAVLCSTKFATVSFAGDRDLRSLASGSEDTTLRVWQVGQDCAVDSLAPQLLQGHSGTLNSVAWAPRGRSLASRPEDTTVRMSSVSDDDAVESSAPQVL